MESYTIYKIENKVNGKLYVGRLKGVDNNYFGSGVLIQKAIKKYGKEAFSREDIEFCDTLELANEREIYWIKILNTQCPTGYNISPGGGNNDTLSRHPNKKEITKKISNTMKTNGTVAGKNNPMYGKIGEKNPNYKKKHRPDSNHKAGGRKLSKLLISTGAHKGEKNPRYGDHRNYKEIHGKENAERMKKEISNRCSGAGNPRAKVWKFTDPQGKEYVVIGKAKEFCSEHNIYMNSLKNSMGKPFSPKIIHKRFEEKTRNSIGWKIDELQPYKLWKLKNTSF